MRSTQQMSITLPNEMAAQVRARVSSGEYATESEVIRDGLRSLQAREKALDSWLSEQVGPAFDALASDPTRRRSLDDVRSALRAERALVAD